MQAPEVWSSLDDPTYEKAFDDWGKSRGIPAGDFVAFLRCIPEFKNNPIMAGVTQIVASYIGIPERGWDHMSDIVIPTHILDEVTTRIRTNLQEGKEYGEYDQGGVPVPADALDPAVEYCEAQVEMLWPQFFEDYIKAYKPVQSDYDAAQVKNQANLKNAADKAMIQYIQDGPIILIGEGHDPLLEANIRHSAKSVGNIQIEKGGVFSKGKLKVWGCTEQDTFEQVVSQFTEKEIDFRS